GLVGQIQREQVVPAFRAGEYGRGLEDTVDAYITAVATKNGFSTDTIFPAGTKPESPDVKSGPGGNPLGVVLIVAIVVIFIAIIFGAIILTFIFGRGGRGGPRGGGGNWLIWLLIGSLLNSGIGRGSSGWRGGGFG